MAALTQTDLACRLRTPVWVEDLKADGPNYSGWYLLWDLDNDGEPAALNPSRCFFYKDYGVTWLAYLPLIELLEMSRFQAEETHGA